MGLVFLLGECYPEVPWQCCAVPFYRIVSGKVPLMKVKAVAVMLKAFMQRGA